MTIALFQMVLNFLLNERLTRVPYANGLMPEGLMHMDTLILLCASVSIVFFLLAKLATLEIESPAPAF